MSLIHKIEEVMMEYGGGSRQSIGAFILEKKGSLTKYSLQEIADATYTSKAAVTRFAKALGFSGWKEFLKAFWEEQSYQDHDQVSGRGIAKSCVGPEVGQVLA